MKKQGYRTKFSNHAAIKKNDRKKLFRIQY